MRTLAIVLLAAALAAPATAGDEPAKLAVAVLDFQAGSDEARGVAASVPDLLEASLAALPGIRLVTRRELDRIQKEQALDLAGLVAKGEGTRVGKLVGADVLVVGRATLVDKEMILLAKAIGVETGVFLPAVVRGDFAKDADKLADQLGKKLAALLEERAGELLPPPDPKADEENRIRKAIANREGKLPTVGVAVFEEHLKAHRNVDPAAETEILAVFKRLGFPLRELSGEGVRDWLARFERGEVEFSAKNPLEVDIVIVGRGFSEFAGRVGERVASKARVEARAIRVTDGRSLGVYRGSTAAADLSEVFAGKKALQELGLSAALELALPVAAGLDEKEKEDR